MKKIFSIFLVLSFLFNAAGYLLIFLILQSSLKENAAERIIAGDKNSSITMVVLAEKEFKEGVSELKFFDENEFSFKGKMYDIIKKENRNDSVYFYCLADLEEDDLNLAFSKNGTSEERGNGSAENSMLKNILQKGLLAEFPHSPGNIFNINYYNYCPLIPALNSSEIPTPPPVFFPA